MTDKIKISSYIVMFALGYIMLTHHLLPAMISGFTVYLLTTGIAEKIFSKTHPDKSKLLSVLTISIIVMGIIVAFGFISFYFIKNGNDNLAALMGKLVSILEDSKALIPANIYEHLPKTTIEMKEKAMEYLNHHGEQIGGIGKQSMVQIVHILMGMIIGAMISLYHFKYHEDIGPFARQMMYRISSFADSFEKVVFSQVKISAINTLFTGIYIFALLPMFDIDLPYKKTLVFITFIAGLIPVVGNLISNTVTVLISLGVSVYAAISSLVFLIIIHKLEYFINAKIIGDKINSSAWELLLSILIMEALFGVSGIVIAPILYAYVKSELKSNHLI